MSYGLSWSDGALHLHLARRIHYQTDETIIFDATLACEKVGLLEDNCTILQDTTAISGFQPQAIHEI